MFICVDIEASWMDSGERKNWEKVPGTPLDIPRFKGGPSRGGSVVDRVLMRTKERKCQ